MAVTGIGVKEQRPERYQRTVARVAAAPLRLSDARLELGVR